MEKGEKKARRSGEETTGRLLAVIAFSGFPFSRGSQVCVSMYPTRSFLSFSASLAFSPSVRLSVSCLLSNERSTLRSYSVSRAREGKYFISRLAWQEKGDTVRS